MSRPRSRNESGLTTLEWLLIVAAVAGLAALAVVLVQNVVDDTAEQIAGNNARITAAQVAAKAITDSSDSDDDRGAACRRLDITYSDAFAGEPPRTAFWSDPDGDKNGRCFIVDVAAQNAMTAITADRDECTADSPASSVKADFTKAQLGGGTVAWDDRALPKCHLT